MSLLASATFDGTDGATVSGFTVNGGTLTITGNRGRLVAPGGYNPATVVFTGGALVADSDVTVEYDCGQVGTDTYANVVARAPAGGNGYNPTGVYIAMTTGATSYQVNYSDGAGGFKTLAYVGLTLQVATYFVRLRVVSAGSPTTTIQTKVWLKGNAEPDWQFSGTTTAAPTAPGYTALEAIMGSATAPAGFDSLRQYDANGVVDPAVMARMLALGSQPPLAHDPISTLPPSPSAVILSSGRYWQPVVVEDFNTPAALGQFRQTYPGMGTYEGLKDTSNNGRYDSDSVLSVANSVLTANLHSGVPSPNAQAGGAGTDVVGLVACVMPDAYRATTYGRYSVRFRARKIAGGLGYKFVWFYFPNNNNWNEGEIDGHETDIGRYPAGRPRPANAIPGSGTYDAQGNGPVSMQFGPGVDLFAKSDTYDYHIATLEWDTDAIRVYWDGDLQAELNDARRVVVPTSIMNFKLQMETVIIPGTPIDPAAVATIEVDWVATWQLAGYGVGAYGRNGYGY